MGQPRPPFVHFRSLQAQILQKNCWLQRDSNSDLWSRRQAHWPFYHLHGPFFEKYLANFTNPQSAIYCLVESNWHQTNSTTDLAQKRSVPTWQKSADCVIDKCVFYIEFPPVSLLSVPPSLSFPSSLSFSLYFLSHLHNLYFST